MRKVSKILLNWFLIVVLIGGFLEVSGKGIEIKPTKITSKEIGVLPVAPGITPAGPVTFCKGGYLVVTGANNNSTFQWQVGGNNISNSTNDSLFVTNSGTYTCIVTNGGNSTTLDNVVVTVEAISISATSTSICNGSSTTLTASGSTTGTYTWITPPATSGAAITVSPTSNTTYSVWSDINSCRDTVSITITVKPKPIASFTYSPNSGCPRKKRKLYFNSTSQQNGAGNLSYSWNFGDSNSNNNTSSNNDPDHSFQGSGFGSSGTYTVTLTVTGNNGCSSTTSQVISIGSFPDATLTDTVNGVPFTSCLGNTLLDLTVNNISTTQSINTNYQINWGDGTSTNPVIWNAGNYFTHTYPSQGYYNLTYVVSSGGCKDSTEYTVFFGSNPAVPYTNPGQSTNVCAPFSLTIPRDTSVYNTPGTRFIISSSLLVVLIA
ncbi:MAG: PKD domain-containing protein [Sphingobacteriales bacterium]|nr:PKD domain-containing protein [Sphingobacteriales bacterium]